MWLRECIISSNGVTCLQHLSPTSVLWSFLVLRCIENILRDAFQQMTLENVESIMDAIAFS